MGGEGGFCGGLGGWGRRRWGEGAYKHSKKLVPTTEPGSCIGGKTSVNWRKMEVEEVRKKRRNEAVT